MKREEHKWFPQKPKTEGISGEFVTVNLKDCRYAFYFFVYGIVMAFIFMFVEVFVKYLKSCKQIRMHNFLS